MSRFLKRAATVAAAAALAALVSACATPSPGDTAGTAATGAWPETRAPGTLDVSDLAGMKPAGVVAILGQPDLKRSEPPAELWQYRAADCVLNLFFYDDDGGEHLDHIETWQRRMGPGNAPLPCRDENAPLRAHLVTQSSF